jgi:hypothetical protein
MCIPSKCARFVMNSLELRENKSGYVQNFILHSAKYRSQQVLKNELYDSKVVLQLMALLQNQGYHYHTM